MSDKRRVMILGVGGQDGSYLAEYLLADPGNEVHGVYRHSSNDNLARLRGGDGRTLPGLNLTPGDLFDTARLVRLVESLEIDEVYNLADQDHVGYSTHTPCYSYRVTCLAPMELMDGLLRLDRPVKFFQPLSATMFGDARPAQSEGTPLNPLSPYAVAKAMLWVGVLSYRRQGLPVGTAVLFNHDSVRRQGNYLLHDIARGVVRLKGLGRDPTDQEKIVVGSLSMQVDVGEAEEYVKAFPKILRQENPDDFVIGSGVAPTIAWFCGQALLAAGLISGDFQDTDWIKSAGGQFERFVREDPSRLYPGPQTSLRADCRKANRQLRWSYKKYPTALVKSLVEHYLRKAGVDA